MKRALMCISVFVAFLINGYSAAAQSPPKYEIFEYANDSTQSTLLYRAIEIDRVANKIWDCHGDLTVVPVNGFVPNPNSFGCYEVSQVAKAGAEAFPNLAQLAAAQQRIVTSKSQIDQVIWLVDQSNGNVHFCLTEIGHGNPVPLGTSVTCYAQPRHPPV